MANSKVMVFILALCFIGGFMAAGLLGSTVYRMRAWKRIKAWTVTEGVLRSMSLSKIRGKGTSYAYSLVLQYNDRDGKEHNTKMSLFLDREMSFDAGQAVQIRYNPENPEKLVLEEFVDLLRLTDENYYRKRLIGCIAGVILSLILSIVLSVVVQISDILGIMILTVLFAYCFMFAVAYGMEHNNKIFKLTKTK